MGLYIRQDTFKFVFVEGNSFENMPLAVQLERRTVPRNLRITHIENNTFCQNQIDICLYQDDIKATIMGNNFAQTKLTLRIQDLVRKKEPLFYDLFLIFYWSNWSIGLYFFYFIRSVLSN